MIFYDKINLLSMKYKLGLWRGCWPNVQRAALVNLGDLSTYDSVKVKYSYKYEKPNSFYECKTLNVSMLKWSFFLGCHPSEHFAQR